VSKWLSEKEAEQVKLKPYEEPALRVKDIEQKANHLSEVMKDLLYKKMKAPKSSTSKKSKSSKTKSTKKGKKTSSSTADDETTTSGGSPPVFTLNPDDELPTEEEISRMISEAKASSTSSKHDEL
jgi:hypoxia up-regulated 1